MTGFLIILTLTRVNYQGTQYLDSYKEKELRNTALIKINLGNTGRSYIFVFAK